MTDCETLRDRLARVMLERDDLRDKLEVYRTWACAFQEAKTENDQLQAEVARLEEVAARLDTKLARALIDRMTDTALLREVEWSCRPLMPGGQPTCPVCFGERGGPHQGHAPDCRLAARLEKEA